jgi:hypothetical protein
VTGDRTAVEAWFLAHGLPYFVAEERAAARAGLRPRRLLSLAAVLVVLAAGAGALAWTSESYAAGPALWLSVAGLGLLWYASTALHARPILGFALSRTLGSLRFVAPMASRALPLLLVFVTFLFVNAEAWEMTTNLPFGLLWVTVLLMFGLAVLFLLTRLPEEVDRVDDEVDDAFLVRACAGTPLEAASREMAADPDIGSLVMEPETQASWIGKDVSDLRNAPLISSVSVSLMKVSLFLASFSGFYFTVSAVTDETYRRQFFSVVESQLERAVGMRAVYLAMRERS